MLPALLAAVPSRAQETLRRTREGQADVLGVDGDDARMNAAMQRARATLPAFNAYLPRAARGEVSASLKAVFREGDEVEHMWITDVTLRDGRYHGTLNNRPMGVRNVAEGDPVTVSPDEVSDWMVVGSDGLMRGGFTVLELLGRMKPKERTRFEAGMDYRVPPDTAIWNAPNPR